MSGWDLLIGFAAALLGALGLGGGSVLLLYLTVIAGMPQLQSQGINLIFFLPAAAISVAVYWKNHLIDFRTVLLAALCGLAGVGLGWLLSGIVEERLLSKLFALLLLVIGAIELFGKSKQDKS